MGAAEIDTLMTAFWDAISSRRKPEDILSNREGGRARYVYSLISPNYLEEAHRAGKGVGAAASLRYRELRLLTDMISGMTDTFAIKLWRELEAIPDVHRR
jgi:dGTPase